MPARTARYRRLDPRTLRPALTRSDCRSQPATATRSAGRRGTLLQLVGVTGNDPDVQRTARELARDYIADPRSLPPTLAPTVLQVAAVGGDAALYDQYLAQLGELAVAARGGTTATSTRCRGSRIRRS